MNNIKVTKVEFLSRLLPTNGCSSETFYSIPDVCADDLPYGVNQKILESFKKGYDVVPVRVTLMVTLPKETENDITEEVIEVARRVLKSVEYLNEADRGMINPDSQLYKKPYMYTVKLDPCSVLYAITCGHSFSVKVIGFLTRAK